jgi:hypothetical protein
MTAAATMASNAELCRAASAESKGPDQMNDPAANRELRT